MAEEYKWFNEFDAKFRELERRAGNTPSRIDWLVKDSAEVRRLVGALYYQNAHFKSRLQSKLFLANVPHWFLDRYRAYWEKFGPAVDRAYGPLSIRALLEDTVDGIPAEEIRHPQGPPPPKEGDPDEITGWFTPGLGEGAEAVDLLILMIWNTHEGWDHAEAVRTGLDAWDWFTETVGIDLAGIEERWEKLPRALVPLRTHESVLDLLSEAVKAYVFGLPHAAIVMCRATCEIVLKQCYVVDDHVGDDGKERPLSEVISLAEKKFPYLKGLDLRKHVSAANKILHNYAKMGRLSDAEDESARQFLETVKVLIEFDPKKTER